MLDEKTLERYKTIIGDKPTISGIIKKIEVLPSSHGAINREVDITLLDGTVIEASIAAETIDTIHSKVLEPVVAVVEVASHNYKRVAAMSLIFGKKPVYDN